MHFIKLIDYQKNLILSQFLNFYKQWHCGQWWNFMAYAYSFSHFLSKNTFRAIHSKDSKYLGDKLTGLQRSTQNALPILPLETYSRMVWNMKSTGSIVHDRNFAEIWSNKVYDGGNAMGDLCNADPEWKAVMLRHFNPLGAHPCGGIGEDPRMPRNLMPFNSKAVKGEFPHLSIFGKDYPTKDGKGIRDYTHIMDVAEGHVAAIQKIIGGIKQDGTMKWSGWTAYFGQGQGNTVVEVVEAFENTSGLKVPYKFVERRRGDIAKTCADHGKAERELGWSAKRSLEQMCIDSWRWQEKNPDGYKAKNVCDKDRKNIFFQIMTMT